MDGTDNSPIVCAEFAPCRSAPIRRGFCDPRRKFSEGHVCPNSLHHVLAKYRTIARGDFLLLTGIILRKDICFYLTVSETVIQCSILHTHPCSSRSIQLFFVAKAIQLLRRHLAVIPTDEVKHNFFGSQHGITSSTVDKLLNTLVYSFLFVL